MESCWFWLLWHRVGHELFEGEIWCCVGQADQSSEWVVAVALQGWAPLCPLCPQIQC